MLSDNSRIYDIVFYLLYDLKDDQEDDGLLDTRSPDENRSYDACDGRSKNRHNGRDGCQKGDGKSIWKTTNYKCYEHYDSQN